MTSLLKLIVILLMLTVLSNCVSSRGGRGTVRTTTTTPKPEISFHYEFTSPICMVKKVAEFNNITWVYTFVGKDGSYYGKNFRYQLELGEEEYEATSITKKSAEELVSEKALNQTKYAIPPKSKTEDCSYSKSATELVHELAQKYKFNLTYELHETDSRRFVARCIAEMINQSIITDGVGQSKRQARVEAAERMYDRLKNVNLDNFRERLKNSAGYNATDVTHIHPVSRLYEIQRQKHGQPPFFRLRTPLMVAETDIKEDIRSKLFAVEAMVDSISVIRTGRTIKEAKKNAAEAALKAMQLPV